MAGTIMSVAQPATGGSEAKRQQVDPANRPRVAAKYGKLPLNFEANGGQTNRQVTFLSRGKGYTLFLTGDGSALSLRRGTDNAVVRTRLLGANPMVLASGGNRLPGTSNYFIGNDPAKWRTGIASYGKVKYAAIYPGVDLVYYGNRGRLEYDFVIAPAADPGMIAMLLDGQLRLGARGDLVVGTNAGNVSFQKPVAYQNTRTMRRRPVEVEYVLTSGNRVSFRVGAYDRTAPLVIDPILSYSTYLGGSGSEIPNGMAVDGAGNVYLTGETPSTDFPTVSPEQAGNAGGYDVFVTKINAAGTGIVYSTYLGGSSSDQGFDVAVDAAGSAYVAGTTFSSNFPTVNAIQTALEGACDAFVAKLSPSGSVLQYSTYLGGSSSDFGLAVAVDMSGSAYVVGQTLSTNFPTANPIQPVNLGGGSYYGGFVSKLSATGSSLIYSTYLNGSLGGYPQAIAVDASANAYVTGTTGSADFPTVNPIQPSLAGGNDAFLSKISAAGSALVYSTYLGGTGSDIGTGIAVDASGNAYVSGYTASSDFPTKRALQPTYGGNGDAFVAKINSAGTALVYSTYLGGSGQEVPNNYPKSIAVDQFGNAYVAGSTYSADFPTVNPTQAANAGGSDAFVAKLNAAGSALLYSSYLGGSANEDYSGNGSHVGVDTAGNIYVYGASFSTDFPTMNPIQAANAGGSDAFLTKIGSGASLSKAKLTFPTQVVGTTSAPKTVTLTNLGSADLTVSGMSSTDPSEFPPPQNACTSVPSGGSCNINVAFSPTASGTRAAKIKITDNELGSPQTITVTGTGTYVKLSPARLNFGDHAVGTTTAAKTVTLTNVGTAEVHISSIATSGSDSQDFLVAPSTCGAMVAGGASCAINLRFKPTATGPRTATLDVADDGGGSPQTVTLTGTGT
jgi:hypothetical protein